MVNPISTNPLLSATPIALSPCAEARDSTAPADHSRWFSEHIQPHEHHLRAYLRGRFPSIRDIDDLVQETFVRVLRAKEIGRAGITRAYLFVIARNAALDQLRQQRIISIEAIAEGGALAVVEDRPDSAEAVSHDQELEFLAEAIATLPVRCREIFVLRRYHDFSHKQIAQRFGIAENTVNAQLVAAMVRCREYLRARGVTPEKSNGHKGA